MKNHLSIRWKLTIPFIFIIAIVIGALLPAMRFLVRNRIEREADQRLTTLGKSTSALIEDTETQVFLSANFVANLEEFKDLTAADTDEIAEIIASNKSSLGLQELSYFGPDYEPGDLPVVYGGPLVTTRLQVSEKTQALRNNLLLESSEFKISTSGIVLAPQASQIIAVAPIDNGTHGYIMAVIYINESFTTRISDILDIDFAIVVDNDIIASTIAPETGYQAAVQNIINMTAGTEFSDNLIFEDSEFRLLGQPLFLNNVEQGIVVVAQPLQELFRLQIDLQWMLVGLAAVTIIVSFFVGYGIVVNFSRPIDALVEATSNISQGDFAYRIENGKYIFKDEIFTLGDNFNLMSDRLQNLYTNLEDLVKERTLELENTLSELEEARDLAVQANASKSDFLANMSHELRTPLNVIIGYAEMLQEDAVDDGNERAEKDLDRILISSRHLLGLINDVLDLSKIEAGKMNLFIEEFNLKDLMYDVEQYALPLIQQKNNQLEIINADYSGNMTSDATKIKQILLNLVSNSAKFTENGKITIQSELDNSAEGNFIQFHVIDTGIGMPPEVQAKIFNAFTQADSSTTRNYGGTGLGLTITQYFTEMLKGEIFVESEENVGTKFSIKIPLKLEAVKEKTEPISHEPKLDDDRYTVLVIDDDQNSIELIERLLENKEINVLTADSAMQGIKMAKEHMPDAILLDIIMPHMDGWATLSQIKNDEEIKDIPVIIISMLHDKSTAYALGASDYLFKPINRDVLLKILDKYRCSDDLCHVLLIEDDIPTREMMNSLLTGQNWTVVQAENGKVGLEQLKDFNPDVIILDLMMPEMDGFEFMENLRNHPTHKNTPVVVLTAKTLTEEEQLFLSGSVERIYQKGDYSKDTLLAHIRDIIQSHSGDTKVIL